MNKQKLNDFLNMIYFIASAMIIFFIIFIPTIFFNGKYAIYIKNLMSFQKTAPQRLYISAWRNANACFYDKTMNNQNWQRWKYKYKNFIKTDEDAVIAINTMIASLNDNYSEFFNKEKFYLQETMISTNINDKENILKNKVSKQTINQNSRQKNVNDRLPIFKKKSVYAELEAIGGIVKYAKIIYVPPQYSILKENDIIMYVDKSPIFGTEINTAIKSLRGTKNKVYLYIIRENKPQLICIPRGLLNIQQINVKFLENKIMYISIFSLMSASTVYNIETIIKRYPEANGYIIDLRGDTGGLFINALYLADDFLEQGKILTIKYRNTKEYTFNAQKGSITSKKPIIILINNKTASSSEIFACALRANNKAILVGETTYGKNSIQQMIPMPNGTCLNLTTAKYSTKNDFSDNQQLTPDIFIENSQFDLIQNKDNQLKKAVEVITKMINNAKS